MRAVTDYNRKIGPSRYIAKAFEPAVPTDQVSCVVTEDPDARLMSMILRVERQILLQPWAAGTAQRMARILVQTLPPDAVEVRRVEIPYVTILLHPHYACDNFLSSDHAHSALLFHLGYS